MCSSTGLVNRSRPRLRPTQTNARRCFHPMADGSRTCRMYREGTRFTSSRSTFGRSISADNGGAVEPVWTREGLFYREGDRMMLVAIRSGAPGELREIFEGQFERDPGANAAAYDVDRRGNFIMLKSALDAARAASCSKLGERSWPVARNFHMYSVRLQADRREVGSSDLCRFSSGCHAPAGRDASH